MDEDAETGSPRALGEPDDHVVDGRARFQRREVKAPDTDKPKPGAAKSERADRQSEPREPQQRAEQRSEPEQVATVGPELDERIVVNDEEPPPPTKPPRGRLIRLDSDQG